jgi:polyisoprenoid-binding protein YceI
LAALQACHAPPTQRIAETGFKPPSGATRYAIDSKLSRIELQLRADGPLMRLGHSHVIIAQQLSGEVWLHPQPERSALQLVIPVESLLVDDPRERAAAGEGFAEPLEGEARSGTREHMLGETQLDGAHYPQLTLRSLRVREVSSDARAAVIDLKVTLRAHTSQLSVPLRWQLQGEQLRASGTLEFKQTDLGLEPYSALLGALRVADRIAARFEIVARR